MKRSHALLVSFVGLLACVGLAFLVGMPWARYVVALGVAQVGLVAWLTQEKKT
jgi:hypothetical protein